MASAITDPLPTVPAAPSQAPAGRIRWIVCGLLFLVTANNYFDRQIFGVIGPSIVERMGWRPSDYADMVTWFEVAYAVGFLVSGRFIDWVGTRIGFALAVGAWSIVSMLHAGLATMMGFKIARAALGLTEAAHLPGAIKVVAQWFPKKERAYATGLYKAGGDVGAIIVPALVPWLYTLRRLALDLPHHRGERTDLAPLLGPPSSALPRNSPRSPRRSLPTSTTGASEADRSQEAKHPPTPWRVLLKEKATYGYIAAKFLTDAIWHWYLYLLPLFPHAPFPSQHQAVWPAADRGLRLRGCRQYWRRLAFVSFDEAWLGGHAGPQVGDAGLLPRGDARGLCPPRDPVWLAVPLVGLAMAAHQGWTSNLFTTVSDLYPQQAVGSVVGLGGTAGMIGAALLAQFTSHLLATTGSYTVIFIIAGSAYLVAIGIFHLLVPSLEPLNEP